MDPYSIFGPLDSLLVTPGSGDIDPITVVVFALAVVNMGTRFLAHRDHVKQVRNAEDPGAELSRFLPHELSNAVLVLGSFFYLTWHHHGGIVLSTLVIGAVITDVFEFESRKVEARKGEALDRPKAAVAASVLVLAYAAYQSLFFIVKPVWSAII